MSVAWIGTLLLEIYPLYVLSLFVSCVRSHQPSGVSVPNVDDPEAFPALA